MLCALLCTSNSIQAAANHSCQGLLRVRLHERSSRRARQFAGWLRSNIAVVKELYLDLPDYDKKKWRRQSKMHCCRKIGPQKKRKTLQQQMRQTTSQASTCRATSATPGTVFICYCVVIDPDIDAVAAHSTADAL